MSRTEKARGNFAEPGKTSPLLVRREARKSAGPRSVMLRFRACAGVHSVAYSADGRHLVVDQTIEGREVEGLRELVWWGLAPAAAARRFALIDTMRSPAYPEQPPIDVSFCPATNRVAVAW